MLKVHINRVKSLKHSEVYIFAGDYHNLKWLRTYF